MLGSTPHPAEAISQDLRDITKTKKDSRGKLAFLVAAMLHAITANTMDLAAHLPLRQSVKICGFNGFLAFYLTLWSIVNGISSHLALIILAKIF